jgi:predicted acetyltransferase
MNIDLTPAAPHERTALENLLQLHTHDFSGYWYDRPEGELDEHGRFAPYPLDAYWSARSHVPLLIRREGRLLGFALLNNVSPSEWPVDWNMAEFFVARKHRGCGVGSAAAHLIFSRYPGQWETAVAKRNIVGLSFWRKIIPQHPAVQDLQELNVNSPRWNGPVLRFRIEETKAREEAARR